MSPILIYVCATLFAISFFLSVGVNAFLLRYAAKQFSKAHPTDTMRWKSAKPTIGGISFAVVFMFAVVASLLFFSDVIAKVPYTIILLCVSMAFVLGLYDDLRNSPVWVKFAIQFLIAIILVMANIMIHLTGIWGVDAGITILWVVGIMNSINMLDNMDGTTSSVSVCILIGCMLLASMTIINLPLFIMPLCLTAALLGFLCYNFHPARLFMGDVGSMILGVLLSIVGILFVWNAPDSAGQVVWTKQILSIAMLYLIPLSDTTIVFYKRIRAGRSPFLGGCDHTSHHLVYAGLSEKGVVGVYVLVEFISLVLLHVMMGNVVTWSMGWALLFLAYVLIVFGILFYIANKNIEKEQRK